MKLSLLGNIIDFLFPRYCAICVCLVILQYHEPGQAMGLSFSVPDGITFPPSLINIFKEIQMDLGTPMPAGVTL